MTFKKQHHSSIKYSLIFSNSSYLWNIKAIHMLEDSYFLNTFQQQKEGPISEGVSRTLSCFMLCRPEALQDKDYILMLLNAITFPIMPCNKSVLLGTCHWVWFLGLSEELTLLWITNFSSQVFPFFPYKLYCYYVKICPYSVRRISQRLESLIFPPFTTCNCY